MFENVRLSRREKVISEFIAMDEGMLELDWESMGYKSGRICADSFRQAISNLIYKTRWYVPVNVTSINNRVYLLKSGCDICTEAPKYNDSVSYTVPGKLEDLLSEFLGSNIDVYAVDWVKRRYKNAYSCHVLLRRYIKWFGFDDLMFAHLDPSHDSVYLVRRVTYDEDPLCRPNQASGDRT